MKNIPSQIIFFQETIPLQILTKAFLLFSPLVPKEYLFQVPCHRTLKKKQKNFVQFSHNSTLTLNLRLSPS